MSLKKELLTILKFFVVRRIRLNICNTFLLVSLFGLRRIELKNISIYYYSYTWRKEVSINSTLINWYFYIYHKNILYCCPSCLSDKFFVTHYFYMSHSLSLHFIILLTTLLLNHKRRPLCSFFIYQSFLIQVHKFMYWAYDLLSSLKKHKNVLCGQYIHLSILSDKCLWINLVNFLFW